MSEGMRKVSEGCYASALPGEPMFVLLARDPSAPDLVRSWALERSNEIFMGSRPIDDFTKVHDALLGANDMEVWRQENNGRWRVADFTKVDDAIFKASQAEPQRERSANDYQPGGDHYRRGGSFQHWDFVAKAGLDYYQGNATKYITRHRHKNGIQDLEKALHYIAKARELNTVNRGETAYLADFAKANNLNPLEQEAIHLIMICNWVVAEDRITGLLSIAGETLQHQHV